MNNPSTQFQSPRALDIAISLVMALFALLFWAGLILSLFTLPQRLHAHPGDAWDSVAMLGIIGCMAIVMSYIAAFGLLGSVSARAEKFWTLSIAILAAMFLLGMLGAAIFEPHGTMRFTWKDVLFFMILLASFLWRKLKFRKESSNHPS